MRNEEFETIYLQYGKEVYLYAYSLCRSHAEAEDLASDAFFKALLTLEKSMVHIKYWLLRVCRNLYIDRRRQQTRRGDLPLPEAVLPAGEDVSATVLRGERHRALYAAIEKLPLALREPLLLFYFANCSIKEIAGITGKTPGAVKTALSRARANLKPLLEEQV